jgi:hypothetical protein
MKSRTGSSAGLFRFGGLLLEPVNTTINLDTLDCRDHRASATRMRAHRPGYRVKRAVESDTGRATAPAATRPPHPSGNDVAIRLIGLMACGSICAKRLGSGNRQRTRHIPAQAFANLPRRRRRANPERYRFDQALFDWLPPRSRQLTEQRA